MKLKTLKDRKEEIELEIQRLMEEFGFDANTKEYNLGSDILCLKARLEELEKSRQEAIKWVKWYRQQPKLDIYLGKATSIMDFFNITEEDLK